MVHTGRLRQTGREIHAGKRPKTTSNSGPERPPQMTCRISWSPLSPANSEGDIFFGSFFGSLSLSPSHAVTPAGVPPMVPSDPSLVDITHDLATLGLILEYDERGFFVVQSVDAGSPAENARVVAGDVVTEFNSVALQPVQRAPAVRKHGIRHGQYAFLRIAKDDACVECALERTLSATDRPRSGNSTSTSSLSPGAHTTMVKQGPPWSAERAGCMLASVHEDFRAALRDIDAFKPLSVDRNSRPPSAVDSKASKGHRGMTMSSNDTGSHGTGNLRWKKLVSYATPSTTASPSFRRVPSSARVRKERGGAAEINLSQALARIEELSQENDALRCKIEQQHPVGNAAWLEQQLRQGQEESQKQLQRTVADFKEREAGYTRQIASLKEELADAHRRVQEVMGACAEYQFQHEKDSLQPSTATMRCLEATCLKIFAIRPAFQDQVCRDVYTMMFSWCFEEWTSPTLAQNIAGGERSQILLQTQCVHSLNAIHPLHQGRAFLRETKPSKTACLIVAPCRR